MAKSRMKLVGMVSVLLVFVTGCRPTEPQPVATLNGEKIMSATCTNSIITPTEQSCRKAVLEKCSQRATIADVGESSRLVYSHPGWTTQYIWTVLIKNC